MRKRCQLINVDVEVIFRHGTQFFRGYYSRDARTAEATLSKLPETKWRERHCICFNFFHSRDVFCTLSCLFVPPGFRLFCARLAVHYLAVYSVSGS